MNKLGKRTGILAIGAALAIAALLLLGTACGSGGGGQPSVKIPSLNDGSTVSSGNVTVTVDPSDFKVVNKLGQASVKGEGHVHYYLDVDQIPTTPGRPAVTAEGTYHATATTSYTWPNVGPGRHTFGVQLVNNDHTPLEPPVTSQVTVTVR